MRYSHLTVGALLAPPLAPYNVSKQRRLPPHLTLEKPRHQTFQRQLLSSKATLWRPLQWQRSPWLQLWYIIAVVVHNPSTAGRRSTGTCEATRTASQLPSTARYVTGHLMTPLRSNSTVSIASTTNQQHLRSALQSTLATGAHKSSPPSATTTAIASLGRLVPTRDTPGTGRSGRLQDTLTLTSQSWSLGKSKNWSTTATHQTHQAT